MKPKIHFEPHLVVNDHRLIKGAEWQPQFRGWCLAHISSGISYWDEQNCSREIQSGSTLVFSAESKGKLRASQLNDLALTSFCVDTSKLSGLLSLREQHFLKQIAAQKNQTVRIFAGGDPISERIVGFRGKKITTSSRLRLLQLFIEVFECEIDDDARAAVSWLDGRGRLRQILNQMVASEFVELSLADLAPMVSCSPRHLNRLFREELGASFREKQIELRLAKACELLATSNAKVVDVALESGYQSSSVFSELFKKRFGVSPGQWRRQGVKPGNGSRMQV